MALNANSLKVSQRAAGANMSVDIAAGDAHLELPSTSYSFWVWTDAVTNLAVAAANTTNPRYDTIVAWADTSVTTTANVNSPGSFKFKVIAGTPAGSPNVVNDAAIQADLGSGTAWIRLADVLRPAGVDSVTNGNISDTRSAIRLRALIAPDAIDSAQIKNDAVTAAKISNAASTDANGWTVVEVGKTKIFTKRVSSTGLSDVMGAGQVRAVNTTQPLPVAIANLGGVSFSATYRSNNGAILPLVNTTDAGTTLSLQCINLSASNSTRTYSIFDLTIIQSA